MTFDFVDPDELGTLVIGFQDGTLDAAQHDRLWIVARTLAENVGSRFCNVAADEREDAIVDAMLTVVDRARHGFDRKGGSSPFAYPTSIAIWSFRAAYRDGVRLRSNLAVYRDHLIRGEG